MPGISLLRGRPLKISRTPTHLLGPPRMQGPSQSLTGTFLQVVFAVSSLEQEGDTPSPRKNSLLTGCCHALVPQAPL